MKRDIKDFILCIHDLESPSQMNFFHRVLIFNIHLVIKAAARQLIKNITFIDTQSNMYAAEFAGQARGLRASDSRRRFDESN